MLPLFNGRKVTSSGQLSVLLRSAAIPASLRRSGGWAMDADGQPYVDTGDVAATRVMNQGIAFTPDGAMYVTSAAPSSTSIRINGVAVSADGAVHYTPDVQSLSGGIGLSSDGRLSIGGGALPWNFSEVLDYYDARYGITEDVGVAAWAPTLKGTHTLEQATDAAQPSWDGESVTCDGSATWLQAAFTLALPTTIVMVAKQPTWTFPGHLLDGGPASNNSMTAYQDGATPNIAVYTSGSTLAGCPASGSDWAVDTKAVVSMIWSTSAGQAIIKTNLGTTRTGVVAATSPNGLTIGRQGLTDSQFGNVQVWALALCDSALSAARLNELIRAMNAQYGVF